MKVAVVGATGMVGGVLLERLQARRFPVSELLPFSSGRTRAAVRFRGRRLNAPRPDSRRLAGADLVFMVSSDEVSERYARDLAARGAWVIDDSSRFRLDPAVPLVIPEVNAAAVTRQTRLIAGPNCTLTGIAVCGYPLHRRGRALSLRIASYQAVSGAGREALLEFRAQSLQAAPALRAGGMLPALPPVRARALPRAIACNVFPQVGSFDGRGESGEEVKVRRELRKIWGAPRLEVAVTAVRVPVVRGHSLAVWLTTERPIAPEAARALLRRAPGVRLWEGDRYPTPRDVAGTDPVHVGRIRRSGIGDRELALWVVSDNLLIGAALNSIRIAEMLVEKGWLRPRNP
jgi:aspartate-semialdehyde dehydrogenase